MQEMQDGQLLLYGGIGADQRPIHDAWLLDVGSLQWRCLFAANNEPVAQVRHARSISNKFQTQDDDYPATFFCLCITAVV